MKNIIASLLLSLLVAQAADTPKKNRFPGQIFSPDVVMHFSKQLELSDEQLKFIHREIDEAKAKADEHQQQLVVETFKLNRLVEKSVTGEDEAITQMKRVIEHEVKLKLIQWRMIVRVKNQLTGEQRKKLADLTKDFDTKGVGPSREQRMRLDDKIAKVKKGMQELADLGVSPEPIAKILDGLGALFRRQKYDEAEALIDQAIKKLKDPF